MAKKIGIITLNGYVNYGNRLQNYALQEVLKKYNYEVDTVLIKQNSSTTDQNILQRVYAMGLNEFFKNVFVKSKKIVDSKINYRTNKLRETNFKEFTNTFINETEYYISDDGTKKEKLEKYDYFVAGSDQIWNPSFINGTSLYFLTFCSKEKRIAYAPSFGVSEIPYEYTENYKNWIDGFNHLSVREDDGAEIIKNLTERTVPVLVDPTLLLSKEQWLAIVKEPIRKPNKNYILTYFLGDIPDDISNTIKQLADCNNLEVIHFSSTRDKNVYSAGPSEFIYYIKDASVFFTDSFHGSVFSILLDTPFVVSNRQTNGLGSMNSRIETLLSKFKLEFRNWDIIKSELGNVFKLDLSHTSKILETEREKAFDYLEQALK